MPPNSPAATAVHRLLDRATSLSDEPSGRAGTVTAVRVLDALVLVLVRWFGPLGAHALLRRALADATKSHPILSAVRPSTEPDVSVEGLATAAELHGTAMVADAATAILVNLTALISRLIGDDLALDLMERALPLIAAESDRPAREEMTS